MEQAAVVGAGVIYFCISTLLSSLCQGQKTSFIGSFHSDNIQGNRDQELLTIVGRSIQDSLLFVKVFIGAENEIFFSFPVC